MFIHSFLPITRLININPCNTDVDYSRHSVFLLAPAQPVVKEKNMPSILKHWYLLGLKFHK